MEDHVGLIGWPGECTTVEAVGDLANDRCHSNAVLEPNRCSPCP